MVALHIKLQKLIANFKPTKLFGKCNIKRNYGLIFGQITAPTGPGNEHELSTTLLEQYDIGLYRENINLFSTYLSLKHIKTVYMKEYAISVTNRKSLMFFFTIRQ